MITVTTDHTTRQLREVREETASASSRTAVKTLRLPPVGKEGTCSLASSRCGIQDYQHGDDPTCPRRPYRPPPHQHPQKHPRFWFTLTRRLGSVTQTDLIDSLALIRASGPLVLTRLEAHGLINRSADPADARRLIISLTGASEAIEDRAHACFEELENVVSRFDAAEVETTFSVLGRMLDDLRQGLTTGG